MMERVQRVVQFVVVKQSELEMHFGRLRSAVERGLVEINRPEIITLGRFPIRLFDQARVSRCDHPIAPAQEDQNRKRRC